MKLYLTQILLNARSRQVRSEIRNPYEMHRTIMRAFPEKMPAGERVLFRLETSPRLAAPMLLVQSTIPPQWSWLHENVNTYVFESEIETEHNPAVKEFEPAFKKGQVLIFRLKANPTQRKKTDGKRRAVLGEEPLMQWLKTKFEQHGAELISVTINNLGAQKGEKHCQESRLPLLLSSVQFEGILAVRDPQLFTNLIRDGIGSAKGLGYGLLTVAPYNG